MSATRAHTVGNGEARVAGRRPLPTAIKKLKGTAQKCRTNQSEPKIVASCPEPPAFLGEIARAEWQHKAPLLAKMGVLTEADNTALAAYCVQFERFVRAEERLSNGEYTEFTTNGNEIARALVGVSNRAAELMKKFLVVFGLTPSSRTRIAANPEGSKSSEWEDFGGKRG